MNKEPENTPQLDDSTVKRFWNGSGSNAAAMSMMAHEHNLPPRSAAYRLQSEINTLSDWMAVLPPNASVLDVGCGAGSWVELFSQNYETVVGVERSPVMVEAARERVAHLPNAQIIEGDVRTDLPPGTFDLIFLGGMCMYLNDGDLVALVGELKQRLAKGGIVILRESTVRKGVYIPQGNYQAAYRNVDLYRRLIGEGGLVVEEVRRNYGYNSLVTAEAVVSFRRKWLPFLPKASNAMGQATWSLLRWTSPLSFWVLPRVLNALHLSWPKLQNHFFKLQA
jgi:SAM-dependent methyltransferase